MKIQICYQKIKNLQICTSVRRATISQKSLRFYVLIDSASEASALADITKLNVTLHGNIIKNVLALKVYALLVYNPCSLVEFTDMVADCLVYSSALNLEAVISLDMLVNFY
jgi:hypothetical protein